MSQRFNSGPTAGPSYAAATAGYSQPNENSALNTVKEFASKVS